MPVFVRMGVLLACLIAPAAARSDHAVQVGVAQVEIPQIGGTQIKIDNFTFGPGKVTIARGGSVTWTNQDDIPHSIVLTAIGVRSKALDTDKTYSYQFDKAGNFSYVCGLHPQMHGQVVVK